MLRKKTRVRIRRTLYIAALLASCICALKGPELLLYNAIHGWPHPFQPFAVLGIAGAMCRVSCWLADGERE